VKAHVEENRTGSRLTNAEKESMERSEKRGNGGRLIGGRGTKRKGAQWGVGRRGREVEGRRRGRERRGEDRGVKRERSKGEKKGEMW